MSNSGEDYAFGRRVRLSLYFCLLALASFPPAKTADSSSGARLLESGDVADDLYAEAEHLVASRKIEATLAAIARYEKVRERLDNAGNPRALTFILRRIGDAWFSINEAQRALGYYSEALTLSQKLGDRDEQSKALNAIASVYVSLGENKRSLRNAYEALTLSRDTADHAVEAQALHVIGDSYYGLGDLQRSLDFYRQSLLLWQQLGDNSKQAQVQVSFGYACLDLSDIQEALNAYQQALDLSRASKDSHTEATALRALGNLQTKLGEHQQALDCFQQSLTILQDVEDRLLKATALAGLGYIHDCLGDKENAIEYFDQAAGIFRAISNRWGEAEVLMDAGNTYYSMGEHQKALDNYLLALSYFKALDMPRYVAQTLRSMGLVYEARGEKDKALDCYNQSLSLTREGQDQRYEAYTLIFLGRFYEGLGNRERALRYYKQALPLNRISFDRYGESLTLYNIAHAERDNGNLAEARARIEAALELVESLRTRVLNKDLRMTYFASSYQCYELYIDILMRQHNKLPGKNLDVLAFEASERARARTLVEMLRETSADIRQGTNTALLDRERFLRQSLEAKTERRANLKGGQNSKAEEKALTGEIEKIAAEHKEIERQIKSANPEYAALMQPEHLSLREIQALAVDEGALLLEYFLGSEKSYLWAVTREAVHSYSLPGRSEIESVAGQVRELLTSAQPLPGESVAQRQNRLKESEEVFWQEAAKLSNILLGPAVAEMEGKKLILVADGILQYIPFGALPDPGASGDLSPLFLNHEITYESSATTLTTLRNRASRHRPASKAVAILADPVFESDDSRLGGKAEDELTSAQDHTYNRGAYAALRDAGVLQDGEKIPRLFASRDEAESIIAMVPDGLGLKAIGFDANKATAVSSDLGQYSIVHFATHGVFNNEKPELSGLMLSLYSSDGKRRDGFLQLNDIYNLDLPVDLVVLSACNTGIGKHIRGEGLLGLTRGFIYAGASRVIASLWKVDDEATAEFMKHFYQRILQEQKPPATGLREAQIALWQQKRWRSPYFWAAFVLKGDYEGSIRITETPEKAGPGYVLAALSVASLLAAIYIVRRRQRRKSYGS